MPRNRNLALDSPSSLDHHLSGWFVLLILVAMLATLLHPRPAHGQWIHTGLGVTTSGAQSDGQGNLYYRGLSTITKIDTSSAVVWTVNAPPAPGGILTLAPDRSNGVIVLCTVNGPTVALSRLNSNGAYAWSNVAVSGSFSTSTAALAVDNAGNSFVGWKSGSNLLITKVNSSGVFQWATSGVVTCALVNALSVTYVRLVPDESGGCYMAWEDFRNGTSAGPVDIYAQHVGSAGSVMWAANGIPIANGTANQFAVNGCSDGAGGAMFVWTDNRSGTDYDVYAQRVDGAGNAAWTANGIRLYTDVVGNPQDQAAPQILADGSGGAFVAWNDYRNAGLNHGSDVFAQRINSGGAVQWGSDGVALATTTQTEAVSIVSDDGGGGLYVGWASQGASVQHLTAAGAPLWISGGVQPLTGTGTPTAIVPDGAGGCYFGYAGNLTRIYPNGKPSWTPNYMARSMAVADIANDEGGWVSLSFDRALADGTTGFGGGISGYSIWKKRPGSSNSTTVVRLEDPRGLLAGLASIPSVGGPLTGYSDFPPGTWDIVTYMPAERFSSYSALVPTSADSSFSSPANDDFAIVSYTLSQSVFVVSPAATGHSVDNLAPGAPQNLVGGRNGGGVLLQWSPARESDFWHYAVYRGTSAGFVPSPANRIGQPTGASLQDDGFQPGVSYYKASTIDRHGNESGFALLTPSQIVSVPPGSTPARTYLSSAAPNPFHGLTALEFGLARRSAVTISIYDMSGRRVKTLVREIRDPGVYRAIWDGADEARRAQPSAVYFARFEADGMRRTVKIVRAE